MTFFTNIISSFVWFNDSFEKKIYLYPKDKLTTYMITNTRSITSQYDNELISDNENVNKLIEEYGKNKFYLDTYSKENDDYVLYFPR